ncbi:MAG TPA: sigma-70 family RNA polymerase sigma factor [Longimicrobium sp.]|nr:sigma-70 family RNA polymerase sigma factor [Longimicrobium sp.]
MTAATMGGGDEWLAARFEESRGRLEALAYRMLGTRGEAEDAVQEAWVRLGRAGTGGVANVEGWFTTIVARLCLDQLRARRARREEPVLPHTSEPATAPGGAWDAEHELVLAEQVGLALLVVLDSLGPAERVAFVLHDLFGLPFDEIAPMVRRTPAATRQLASRARRRVRGATPAGTPDRARQRRVAEAYLAASRGGDLDALLAVLDPEVVLRVDETLVRAGAAAEVRGAREVAGRALAYRRLGRFARPALVDGAVGVIVAPAGRLRLVMRLDIHADRITAIELVAAPERLRAVELAVLEE